MLRPQPFETQLPPEMTVATAIYVQTAMIAMLRLWKLGRVSSTDVMIGG